MVVMRAKCLLLFYRPFACLTATDKQLAFQSLLAITFSNALAKVKIALTFCRCNHLHQALTDTGRQGYQAFFVRLRAHP